MKKSVFRLPVVAVFACLLGVGTAALASDTITLSQGEIQALVYKSHLLTLMDDKPELEAGIVLLLELDRRNPDRRWEVVAALRAGMEGYRDAHLSQTLYPLPRDVIVASFMEYVNNFVEMDELRPATLTILNDLIVDSYSATGGTSIRSHAGNHEVLGREHAQEKREACIDLAVERAVQVSGFAEMLDRLLYGETSVSVRDAPVRILALNTALGESPTLQWLASLYAIADSGPVDVPVAEFEAKFTQEMTILKETITTNQAMLKELEAGQGEIATYLSDPARIAQQQAYQTQVRFGQSERIASSSAAAHAISFTMRTAKPDTARHMRTVATSMKTFAKGLELMDAASKFGKLAACTNFLSAGLSLASIFFDTGPSPEEMILEEINALKQMIQDLATHIDYRFDRVDQTLNVVLDQLDYTIQLIGEVGQDVDQLRLDMLDVQAGLCRLEREIYSYLDAGFRRDFVERLNGDLRYELLNSELMAWSWYRDVAENEFYSWAVSHSLDDLSSYTPVPADLTDEALPNQLSVRPLESNLNFINEFLIQRLGVTPLSSKGVPSPRDWFAGADAYIKLAVENPLHFRRKHWSRIDDVISAGRDLESFLGGISLLPSGEVNTQLFDAVLDYYGSRLDNFTAAVDIEKAQYAEFDMAGFDYSMWEDWERECTPLLIEEAAVTGRLKSVRLPTDIVQVAAGDNHTLALRENGTVIAWGYNAEGACDVPPAVTNAIAVAAGGYHSLALTADGDVLGWGANYYGQCDIPPGLNNVVAIEAGPHHNIALRSDGTVATWGYMAMPPPAGLSDVVQIAAGGDTNRDTGAFCLALKSDNTVVGWGTNYYGELNIPAQLANGQLEVLQIEAKAMQAAALLADGTILAWPDPVVSSGNIAQISFFNWGYSLALRNDGTVEVIKGDSEGAPLSDDVVQVAAGSVHAVALHDDGHLSIWGNNRYGTRGFGTQRSIVDMAGNDYILLLLMDDGSVEQVEVSYAPLPEIPPDLPPLIAVAVGRCYQDVWCLGLTEEGTVVAWGENGKGQCNVPAGLTNVVAISAPEASDGGHSLALKKDGTVVGWGDNTFGQRNPPSGLENAVAIAAGWRHSAALKSDGTVVTWGSNYYGQRNVPAGLDQVVAISSRRSHVLALKSDGTVVAWGENAYGQSNVPASLTDVVAVEAGEHRSLALKADGSVVSWGDSGYGALGYANSMTGVVKMNYAGSFRDHFLVANEFPSNETSGTFELFPRTRPSPVVAGEFSTLYGFILYEFDYDLHDQAAQLTGSKQLLDAILSLGLSQSFENDDALRGLLLGTEGVPDTVSARAVFDAEAVRLQAGLWERPADLEAILAGRFEVFQTRLFECLDAISLAGQPEIPHMVRQTLSLLEILRSSHRNGVTPSAVFGMNECAMTPSLLEVSLFGEPYIHYNLKSTDYFNGWSVDGQILHSGESAQIELGGIAPSAFLTATVAEAP